MEIGTMRLTDIRKASPLKDLYEIRPHVLEIIENNMREFGYDKHKPIIIWKEEKIIVDGHMRFEAADELGFDRIPVKLVSFEKKGDAVRYAIKANLPDKIALMNGSATNALLKQIPRCRLEAMLKVYHKITAYVNTHCFNLMQEQRIKTPSGKKTHSCIPPLAAERLAIIAKNLLALRKYNYLQADFVEDVIRSISARIFMSFESLSRYQKRNMLQVGRGTGRPKDYAFATLLHFLTLHTRLLMGHPSYRIIGDFLFEQDVARSESNLRKVSERLKVDELEDKYRSLFNEPEEAPEGYIIHRVLPTWESLSDPKSELDYEYHDDSRKTRLLKSFLEAKIRDTTNEKPRP